MIIVKNWQIVKKNEIKKLENELKYLEELSNTSTYKEDTSLKQKLEITIKRLDKLYTEKTKGRQIRSRVKWIVEGEKNTAFYLGLEKTRQTKKAINELYDKNGTTDQNEIMEIEVDYYKKLYKSTNPDNDKLKKYIENTKVHNKLNNNESEKCEGEITIEECTNAIIKMKLNKAPGLDGLSVKFYRKFWNSLKKLVTKVFNFNYERGHLSNSQKIGAISLNLKKNDSLSLDNYRPITLLNTDTKILAYTIAQRLKEVLPSIIHSDQKGYFKNRYIGFNIRQIQDVIDHSEKFNIEGAILFLDFTKAFDSLEWSFMTKCLEKFGFKSPFIRWIRTMYTDIKGCILNNGWVSAPFKVFRGIRQGCPASALIFVLAVEIMAIKLRETKHIRGIE